MGRPFIDIALADAIRLSHNRCVNFAPFWARGECEGYLSWRWSFSSLAEAQALADQAARQVAERFRAGNVPQHHRGYYPNRPFRELVLQEIKNAAGEVVAVVTRNSYGCLVLNTSRVMFVDVDLPEQKRTGGLLKRLFGKPDPTPPNQPQADIIAKADAWIRNHPGWGWRIYRTRAGLRLLATHTTFDPAAAAADGVFAALDADPLYRQLCITQKCFRARLTPKPWRCDVYRKPERWPWLNSKAEAMFKKWDADYQAKSAAWATCEFLGSAGNTTLHPEVQLVLGSHDVSTRAESKLALA
jgi:hypothetical protein